MIGWIKRTFLVIRAAKTDGRDGRADFDFSKVADVDDATVEAFFNSTSTPGRQMPLLIARYIFNQLEGRLTDPGKLDSLQLSEIRGGMRALRAFGAFYTNGIESWKARKRENDDAE